MMDIFTVLLLFLLKSFVVEGEAVVPPPGLELPPSTAQSPAQTSLVVAIDDDAILLGNERIASVSESVSSGGLIIAPLDTRLKAVRRQQQEIAVLRGLERPEDQVVTIQGDRQIEFRILKKVMYTLNQNGYENIALAVIKSS